jgi:hypothetical protein
MFRKCVLTLRIAVSVVKMVRKLIRAELGMHLSFAREGGRVSRLLARFSQILHQSMGQLHYACGQNIIGLPGFGENA